MTWSRVLVRSALLLLGPAALLTSSADAFLTAKALISGGDNGITGQALFVQDGAGNVIVTVTVKGPPNVLLQGRHGVHIHEVGACDPPAFTTAGGHFDPGPNGNSNTITNHPYHLGDLQNLEINAKGEGAFVDVTTRVSLTPSDISLFDTNGSAIIVHQLEDQQSCQAAFPGGPCTGVSGGPRLACGVIKLID